MFDEHANCAVEMKNSPQFASHSSNELDSTGSQSPEIHDNQSPLSQRHSSPTPSSSSLSPSYLPSTATSTTLSVGPYATPVTPMAAPPHPAQVILPQYLTNNLPLAAQPQPVYYAGLWIPVQIQPLPQPPFQLYTNMSPTGLAPAQPFPQPATPTFTGPFWVSKRRFQVKFNTNRAKGNFYISKENIGRMGQLCHDPF